MKIYTTLDSVEELDYLPRSERKATWSAAWKTTRKNDKSILFYPLLTGILGFCVSLVLMHSPANLVNITVAMGIAAWVVQQLSYRKVIPYINK